jgi:hypothetical protein
MVSDVLHKAIEETRDYLKEFPDVYTKEWRKPIGRVIAEMIALLEELQAPRSPERVGNDRLGELTRREEEFARRREEERRERAQIHGPRSRQVHPLNLE